MSKPCPLIENGEKKPPCYLCSYYHRRCTYPYTMRKVKSDKTSEKYYQCLSCFEKITLYFDDEKLEEVKEVAPREYRGSRKLTFKLAGKYVQEGGKIYHRHFDNSLHLCQEIKRRTR